MASVALAYPVSEPSPGKDEKSDAPKGDPLALTSAETSR